MRLNIIEPDQHPLLMSLAQQPHIEMVVNAPITVSANQKGLQLSWQKGKAKLNFFIDVASFVSQQKSFPSAKQGALNQALGKKTRHILDASAGWGADAMLFLSQGYNVTLVERHPLMVALLQDAIQRLLQTNYAQRYLPQSTKVVFADATFYLQQKKCWDCVYFDPMFPDKDKRKAASNKYMQFLQHILTEENNAQALVLQALQTAKRVVVKRPHYAPILAESLLKQRFVSKLVHYDVYWSEGTL